MKTLDEIKIVGILGAGTMGQGIAQVTSLGGYKTLLYDINQEMLLKAHKNIIKNLDKGIEKNKISVQQKETALSNLIFIDKLEEVQADLVIEAVVEKLTIKQSLFEVLEKNNDSNTIFATNTSSIPITQIASSLQTPDRLVGMHFFNPAHIMKLVEVISGTSTSTQVSQTIYELAKKLGKTPVMAKDSPGFIVNRVARHYYVESLKVAEECITDFKAIDTLLEAVGFKMGPFRLMDLIGVETNLSVTRSMYEAFFQDSKFRPSRIQQQKVDAGHFGRKANKGFYDY